MAELVEPDEPEDVRPLLEEILEELYAIKDKWREIGEVLEVSKTTLRELQSRSKGGNFNDKDNFEVVMKEWIEKNTSKYLWPPLLQALNNSDLDMSRLDLEGLKETHCSAISAESEHQNCVCNSTCTNKINIIVVHVHILVNCSTLPLPLLCSSTLI